MPKDGPPQTAPPSGDTAGPLVVTLVYDGLCSFEFGVAHEVFGLPRPEMGSGWYRFAAASVEPGPIRSASGLQIAAETGLEALAEADVVVAPGWRGIDVPVPEPLIEALRAAQARGAEVVSLCSGVVPLAAAGLLDGRRATTHWRYLDSVRARFPATAWVEDVLYVDDGRVLSAAGSAAGIDLCLHVVRRHFGVAAANSVARRLVVPPHRDGAQPQKAVAPVARAHESARLGAIFDFIQAHLSSDLSIAALAVRAGMSPRTFQRRFLEAAGVSAGRWILQERVRAAQQMLEATPLGLEDVALRCGFGSADALRRPFKDRFGLTPSAYRALSSARRRSGREARVPALD